MTGPWQAAFLVLAAMVLALGIIVLGLLRRFSEALERVESRVRRYSARPWACPLVVTSRRSRF